MLQQQGQSGGNTVSPKEVDLAYNALGQFTTIADFNYLNGGPRMDIATGAYFYDTANRFRRFFQRSKMDKHLHATPRIFIMTLGGLVALAMWPRRDALAAPPADAPRVLAEFSIAERDPLWFVRATVRGKEYQMVVDTGSSATVIDAAHREILGNIIATGNVNRTSGLTPIRDVQMFGAPAIELGAVTLKPWGAICLDLSGLSKVCSTKIDGILGMDVLRRQVIAFDPDERTLRFCGAAGPRLGQRVAIEWSNKSKFYGKPMVDVVLADGERRRFLIDTGINKDLLDGTNSGSIRRSHVSDSR